MKTKTSNLNNSEEITQINPQIVSQKATINPVSSVVESEALMKITNAEYKIVRTDSDKVIFEQCLIISHEIEKVNEDQIEQSVIIDLAFNKILEAFVKGNDYLKNILIGIVRKYKDKFKRNELIKYALDSSVIPKIFFFLKEGGAVAKNLTIQLMMEIPFVLIDLELVHVIFDFYMKEEYIEEIERIFESCLKLENYPYAKEIKKFMKNYQ